MFFWIECVLGEVCCRQLLQCHIQISRNYKLICFKSSYILLKTSRYIHVEYISTAYRSLKRCCSHPNIVYQPQSEEPGKTGKLRKKRLRTPLVQAELKSLLMFFFFSSSVRFLPPERKPHPPILPDFPALQLITARQRQHSLDLRWASSGLSVGSWFSTLV